MDHLRPEARRIAEMSAVERLDFLATDRWIGYSRAQDALKRMGMLLATQPGRVRPQNMLIVGPSNNGKSTIAEKFLRQHPRRSSEERDRHIFPVLSVQMIPDVTAPRFYAQLLDALGSPFGKMRQTDRRNAVTLNLMQACGVRLLLIDELHNLLCGPSSRQREILGLIRYLGNELRIPIVALGTRDAWLALRLDDQLENRFQPFLLSRWDDGSETGRLLASFETVIPLRETSGLGLPALRAVIVERSEGLIGEMHQLLSSATAHALMEGRERIVEDDLVNCIFQAPSFRRQMMERELRA
ncbi:TniB family NTP-binding protein [Salipiger sp. 1_MG-2023]|uniref:TniB family NTP-binding protein n=1 Tax=Salipiger sp. 1_MG-2023 TaxID=3062665 RepID=UPI0026E1EF65|nr:TniB family NTP-binding protein [Salipiger sp. 1_MG-2023]MDO6585143.1 TniB family NTP-binding protein [Salipiger sp. 1_MG-2023]